MTIAAKPALSHVVDAFLVECPLRIELAIYELPIRCLLNLRGHCECPILLHACEGPTDADAAYPGFSTIIRECLAP